MLFSPLLDWKSSTYSHGWWDGKQMICSHLLAANRKRIVLNNMSCAIFDIILSACDYWSAYSCLLLQIDLQLLNYDEQTQANWLNHLLFAGPERIY